MGWDIPWEGGLIYTGLVFWADSKIARANALFLGVDQEGGGGHFISGASLFSFFLSFFLVFEFCLLLSSLGYERIPPLLIMMRGIVIVHASESIVVMYNSSLRGDAGILLAVDPFHLTSFFSIS